MIVLEFKAKGKTTQYNAIDEAIRTAQFVRNKSIRFWMDNRGVGQKELYRIAKSLRSEFSFVKALNSSACQASIERAYSSIARFYDSCKKSVPGKKGYPKFKKNSRSVEYKTSGWSLSQTRKQITFTDKKGIGKLKLKGTWDLSFYQLEQIKRVRLVRRADGYYVQFLISADNKVETQPTGKTIGLDVGLKEFYTDSNGYSEPNPRFYRTGEKRLKFRQKRVSRKKKGSTSRKRAINRLGRVHLKISRQREEHAKRVARCVIQSNDLVAYEDLRIKNLVKNHCLAKSINDAGWYQFRKWLEFFGVKFGRITVAVNPAYTSQECSNCGAMVKKSLSTRTHACECGFVMDRDWNAAINILKLALSTVGHTGTWVIDPNASGDSTSTHAGEILSEQVGSKIEESSPL
ncbi:RNA-guided endonuclease InsQ/TnpB family protein [Anabaena sp. FACHB-709]|uniref:Transposase n=2 Tax=Nostocaceae TaxID=1162 RepID=A0A1Z4KTJ5_ANAVA|nr:MULTISPECIES: RNA-guided endonuclease TnpB family protein [Nostocaceae]BAY72132.1 transposase [Trichormus variabilis NIES-23]HBW28827.1 transposase [Nostoc sp. UBA8866]MBD2171432.1 transposase [Anabaena cylindrica FACHB-318]MBD2263215.1 transposase [Anabaena sp. FACHB-709]MBD2272760.1 transposase [Nostoc sp. PCC 7120 = FACHB-418]